MLLGLLGVEDLDFQAGLDMILEVGDTEENARVGGLGHLHVAAEEEVAELLLAVDQERARLVPRCQRAAFDDLVRDGAAVMAPDPVAGVLAVEEEQPAGLPILVREAI